MKALFIGGTGNISSAVSKHCVELGIELYILTRGKTSQPIPGTTHLVADIEQQAEVSNAISNHYFDVVVNWIAFKPGDIERDYKLFKGHARQYIFISSASAYQKPLANPFITESTPLKNPFWDYSRDKIACEERLNQLYREHDFPMTIVRPSLTYKTVIPVAIGSWDDYTIIDRIKKGKEVIVHGDGTSLWTITHADDFARGFVGLMNNPRALGHAFHITSDEILTWDQVYQLVAEAVGKKARVVHVASDFICQVADEIGWEWMRGNLLGDKAVSAVFDNSKIKSFVPGFQARIPFREGIKNTIQWFEADPARMKIVKENNEFIDMVLKKYRQHG